MGWHSKAINEISSKNFVLFHMKARHELHASKYLNCFLPVIAFQSILKMRWSIYLFNTCSIRQRSVSIEAVEDIPSSVSHRAV